MTADKTPLQTAARAFGIAETAILGSTLRWSLQAQSAGFPHDCWVSAEGYQVMSQGDNPKYWTALDPTGRDLHAAGAGDFGLAKCIRACERHFQSHKVPSPQQALFQR